MNTYECEGCGAIFNGSAEDAFEEGWDTPERFMSHCTCPNCAINTTAWWRIVVLKEKPTEADMILIAGYNQMWKAAQGDPA